MRVAWVVVRFKSGVALPYVEGAVHLQATLGQRWQTFTDAHPGVHFTRVFDDPDEQVPDDEAYYEVRFPDVAQAQAFVQDLKRDFANEVDEAFVRRPAMAPHDTGPAAPPMATRQGYFQPGPQGINAVAAWKFFEAFGDGVGLADIETGWALGHVDLPGTIELLCGENARDQDHGTSVLGILAAKHSGSEVLGGIPRARTNAASYVRSADSTESVAWAIDKARRALSPGDVLLLEAVTEFPDDTGQVKHPSVPMETQSDVRTAIDRCTRKGILVIEPAGNSRIDLGLLGLEKNPSGALVVGASNYDETSREHRCEGKESASNFGTRVDCFAWGHDVYTLDTNEDGRPRYRPFGNTSGAAAIIASAAVLVQSFAKAKFNGKGPGYLTPEQLRNYLCDPANATPSADRANYPIGVMPDLNKVMDKVNADIFSGAPPAADTPTLPPAVPAKQGSLTVGTSHGSAGKKR